MNSKKILIFSTKIEKNLPFNIQKYSKNQVFSTSYKSLIFNINPNNIEIFDTINNFDLKEYNLIYFKQYGLETKACVIYLQLNQIPFLNPDLAGDYIFNKLDQYMVLESNNFVIPPLTKI